MSITIYRINLGHFYAQLTSIGLLKPTRAYLNLIFHQDISTGISHGQSYKFSKLYQTGPHRLNHGTILGCHCEHFSITSKLKTTKLKKNFKVIFFNRTKKSFRLILGKNKFNEIRVDSLKRFTIVILLFTIVILLFTIVILLQEALINMVLQQI